MPRAITSCLVFVLTGLRSYCLLRCRSNKTSEVVFGGLIMRIRGFHQRLIEGKPHNSSLKRKNEIRGDREVRARGCWGEKERDTRSCSLFWVGDGFVL